MSDLRSRVESHLAHVLLAVTLAEMAVYRLLVPSLRPRADLVPPWWHTGLTYLGLFLFYFASALAVGVVVYQVRELFDDKRGRARLLVYLFTPIACVFLVVAVLSIIAVPSEALTFLLEASFVACVVVLVLLQLVRRGDVGARIGLVLLALPLIVHFYAPLSVRYITGEEALFNGISDDVEQAGRWLVLGAALSMPYCFGARPFLAQASRVQPVVAALAVGILGTVLVRHDYVAGMKLAQNGLGFSIAGPAPGSLIALCLLALSALTWTLVNCLGAASASRRRIGIGIALVVAGGYAFAWPLQYLVGIAGLLAITKSTRSVVDEEQVLARGIHIPAIDDEVWQRYLRAVLEGLRFGESGELGTAVTIAGEGDQSRSHLVIQYQGLEVTLTIERVAGSIIGLDVRCGDGDVSGEPVWTLYAKEASALGIVHPRPPSCRGRKFRGGKAKLDDHFEIVDGGAWSDVLLGDSQSELAGVEFVGWMAVWANGTLRYQVYPGRGTPLNRPIPITELSLNTGKETTAALVALVQLLTTISVRAHKQNDDTPS